MLTMKSGKALILAALSLAVSATITVGAVNVSSGNDDGTRDMFDGEAKFYFSDTSDYNCGSAGEEIPFPGAIDGREYYYSDGTATASLGYDWFTDKDMTKPVISSDKRYVKGTLLKFYGKESSIGNNNGQVSFCGFDNLITDTENGVLDEKNRYYVSKTLGQGFVNKGFTISDEGAFTGDKFIVYKSPSPNEADSIVDISNGVALKPYVTYKLALYYKSTGNADLRFEGVNSFADSENNEQPLSLKTVAKTDDWTKAELYFTSGSSESIPVIRVKAETGVEVSIDTVSIYKVVYSDYSAVADADNTKKLTLGFSYGSVNGSESTVGLSTYEVKERGIIAAAEDAYGKDAYDMLTIENTADINSKLIWAKKSSGLEDSLLQQDGKYTYSISISGFKEDDTKKILARGYLILNDGTDTIWYSDVISTSVKDVSDEAKRVSEEQKRIKTYELNDNDSLSKLNLQGRDYLRSGYPNLDWTASEIEFWATASGNVEVSMDVNIKARSQIYFTVYVDDVRQPRMGIYHSSVSNAPNVVKKGKATLNIDLGKDYKEHHIRIIRQTEAYSATITVKSLTMFGELNETKAKEKTLIEFIGDSITGGLGDMTLGSDTKYYDPGYPDDKRNYGDGNQDGTIAYPFLTAENIGYDRRVLSRSGISVYYPNSTSRDFNDITLSWTNAYKYTNVFDANNQTAEYSAKRKADIVCINLGTNDTGANNRYKYVEEESFNTEFAKKVKEFLVIVRNANPEAKIVWVVGGMTDSYLAGVQTAITDLGGEKEKYYLCKVSSELKDGVGAHPSKAQHAQLADELTKYLNENILK